MPTALVTGANRGIGLAFCRSLTADGWRVHACCRSVEKAKSLKALQDEVGKHRLDRHRLDVTDGLQVASLARDLLEEPIDLLLNNAGIMGPRSGFGETDYDDWLKVLKVNTLAPMRVSERFADLVAASERKVIALISSDLGSIARNESSGLYPYRSSKAALNMVGKGLSVDLRDRGITVVMFHPGWVQTDMGGEEAQVTPKKSVAGMRRVIDGLTLEQSGEFFSFEGDPIPW